MIARSVERWELVLEDGSRYPGRAFGAARAVAGEVVFGTGMAGYVEALTDPSYRGQILVLTYPLEGNYGVARQGAPAFESPGVQVQGLVVASATRVPSHHDSERSLGDWLRDEKVPGLEGVDTRDLTKRLRESGTMQGWLLPAGLEGDALRDAETRADACAPGDLARLVAPRETTLLPAGDRTVLFVDSGGKEGIVRELLHRSLSVLRAPFHADLPRLAVENRVRGVVLGNGPGDPKDLPEYVAHTRALMSLGVPVLGVCLGSQIVALAAGGDTYKLRYGHRSQNQPVRDLDTGRCFITSQNHGYAVRAESLPAEFAPWFVNLNDGTNEGLRHRSLPIRAVQFHPEGAPGPEDTRWLFD
ncbi:MAG TPA: glutamine-hydrolyzing carbamoyl-phosphate synthase small subunit, partial [Polyangiaceae bacterium]|nr:glutamine-hydrolyzing carbamoyl-phosphate synthase small subunit [Polyangiaceae bacterium]